jgi:hypothetical protein
MDDPLKKHAIFTIVQNEPFFFPLWYRYYSGHYHYRKIYVLYHPLPQEDTLPEWIRSFAMGMNLVRVRRDKSFDHAWLRDQVEKFAAFLLGSYDTVTFTEIDEFLAVDPTKNRNTNLTYWFDNWCRRRQPAARCTGYEVVHRFDEEPDLDLDGVLHGGELALKDRGWWYHSEIYSKTLTWRIPPQWDTGFHDAYGNSNDVIPQRVKLDLPKEPDLLLLHLHKVDYKMCVDRWKQTKSQDWNEADLKHPHAGYQNRYKDEAELRSWWYRSIDPPLRLNMDLVPMPEAVRSIV